VLVDTASPRRRRAVAEAAVVVVEGAEAETLRRTEARTGRRAWQDGRGVGFFVFVLFDKMDI
jgi:hypothetical protein